MLPSRRSNLFVCVTLLALCPWASAWGQKPSSTGEKAGGKKPATSTRPITKAPIKVFMKPPKSTPQKAPAPGESLGRVDFNQGLPWQAPKDPPKRPATPRPQRAPIAPAAAAGTSIQIWSGNEAVLQVQPRPTQPTRQTQSEDRSPALIERIAQAKGPEELAEFLGDSDPRVQTAAADAILEHGAEGRALLAQTMETGSPRSRAAATWGLRNEEPSAQDIERLAAGLRHDDPELRRVSMRVAGHWGSPVVSDAVLDALSDHDASVREAASEALVRLGDDMVPGLIKQLSTGEEKTRSAACAALIKLGAPAVAPLAETLDNENPAVRYWAAHSLGSIGRPSLGTLDTLKKLAASDPDATVRYYADVACRKLTR